MRCLSTVRISMLLFASAITSSTLMGCGGSAADGTSAEVSAKGLDAKKAKIEEIRQQQIEAHKQGARKGR